MYDFTFHRPKSLRKAAALLAENGEAKLIAGGHTLLPTMKQRLAAPSGIIDLSGIPGLSGIALKGRRLEIGAMTRHDAVATSPVVREALPALAALAGLIGDPAVRNRGTIGGSIANNDPAADYPAACLALAATIVTNRRRIAADDFFTGLFETALEEDEIITRIVFPLPRRAAYAKFRNPASRYAMAGVFVARRGRETRVAVTGAGADGVFRLTQAEEMLSKRFSQKALAGLNVDPAGLVGDIHGSPEYRANLVTVMTGRAVAAALRG